MEQAAAILSAGVSVLSNANARNGRDRNWLELRAIRTTRKRYFLRCFVHLSKVADYFRYLVFSSIMYPIGKTLRLMSLSFVEKLVSQVGFFKRFSTDTMSSSRHTLSMAMYVRQEGTDILQDQNGGVTTNVPLQGGRGYLMDSTA